MKNAKRRVAVVTDSSAYLPPELVEEHGIHVVPVTLTMGDKTWRDGVDIDPPTFYELLRTSPDFPTTSQPNVGVFLELFIRLSQEVEGIVAVLITSKLSGTVASAQAAAAELPDIPIEIVDSLSVSMGLGFPVLAAARAAAEGADLKAVADTARKMVEKTGLYILVGTLEYLRRGGRISGAAWLLGSALNLKPILEFREGILEPVAKVRTRSKALRKLYQLLEEQVSGGERVHMAVLNAAAVEEAAVVKAEVQERFKPVELLEALVSPAIGVHAGPGTVGVAFYVE